MKVGDICFLTGEHRNKPEKIETVISKIGRVYFYCAMNYGEDLKFYKKTKQHHNGNYSAAYYYWESKEEYIDYNKARKMRGKIQDFLRHNDKISIKDCLAIFDLLNFHPELD